MTTTIETEDRETYRTAHVIGVEHRYDYPGTFGIIVRCPWCRGEHQHGGLLAELDNDDHGHRVQHCGSDLLRTRGYRTDRADWPNGYVLGPVPQKLRDRLRDRMKPAKRATRTPPADPMTVKLSKSEQALVIHLAERAARSED